MLRLGLPYDESDPRVEDAVDTLRADLVPPALDDLDAEYAVGGDAAEARDFVRPAAHLAADRRRLRAAGDDDHDGDRVPQHRAGAGVLRAQPGVVSASPSGCSPWSSSTASGEGLLDFSSPGFVIDWIPLFVLVVLVGLSMDYHVFVLSRVREHVQRGLPSRLAVERGITDTAGVVTSAAAVMVSVFAIFATLSMLEMKMMGVGLVGRDPHRRDADPAGHAARRAGAPGRPGLVARTNLTGPR